MIIRKSPREIEKMAAAGALVAETIVHEIAHHFGISDERLEGLGWD